jgi:two-component system, chemotaxis family, CheB/CheR fusion protein
VQTRDGSSYRLHIVPYRTIDNAIDGVVITFTDITDFRKMAERMTERTEYAEAIIRTVREPLVVLDRDMKVMSANTSFYRMFHVAPEETEGQTLYALGNGQWNNPAMRQLLENILPQNTQIEWFLMEHEFPIIGKRRMLLNARRIARENSHGELILLAIEDITNNNE